MSTQRTPRFIRNGAMDAGDTAAAPPFSIGTTSTNGESPTRRVARRSTRRAAAIASTRIAQGAAGQRRSTRLAARKAQAARTSGGGRSPASGTPRSATRARGIKETPMSSNGEDTEEMDLKPAAVGGKAVAGTARSAAQKPPPGFTCAICLDAPSSMTEVASIDGCTHRFCFDCIDRWALTENTCPCCKARFRTIDRAAELPRKRKRAAAADGRGSTARARRGGGASPARPRVNSRAVEERSQQSLTAFPINAAMVEQILASFSGFGGQVTFGGTDEAGRGAIRMIFPSSGRMVGVVERSVPGVAGGGGGNEPAARGTPGSGRTPSRTAASGAPASGGTRGSARLARGAGAARAPARPASARSAAASVVSSRAASASTRATRQFSSLFASQGGAGATSSPAADGSASAASFSRYFSSLFASQGGAGATSSPAASGSASAASFSRTGGGSSSRPNIMTIRVIARQRAADSSRRTTGASTSGADPDQPEVIVID